MTSPDDGIMVPRIALEALGKLTSDSAATRQQLIDSYRRETYRLRAELLIIRTDVDLLFRREYLPSPAAVLAALHPEPADIEKIAASIEADDEDRAAA